MKLKTLLSCLVFILATQAQAQGDNTLPDQPLEEDVLSFESDVNATEDVEASPVIEPPASVLEQKPKVAVDTAPQEPPFTQEDSEFEDADNIANDERVPVIEAPPVEATLPVRAYKPYAYSGKPSKGVERIEHPMAAKGLIRIEKDGSYIYRTEPRAHNQSSTFRIGVMQPPNIQAADGTDFKTMYTQEDIAIAMFDYEWQPFSNFGKLGIQAGLGFFTAQGNGRFLDGSEAREKYTFYAFPVNLGVVYRLEFTDRQWLAPYVAGGGTYFALLEMRDDDKGPKGVGVPAAYGAAGAMFNVSAFDRETAFTLASEYGISNLWVTFEYRYVKTFTEDVDLSSGMMNLGFAVDY